MARDLNFENGEASFLYVGTISFHSLEPDGGAWSTEPDGKGALPGSPAAAGIGVDWSRPATPPRETWNRPCMTRCPVVFTTAKSESHPQ